MEQEKANSLLKEYETEKSDKSNWTNHWDDVAKYGIPRKDNVYGQLSKGDKTGQYLFANYAVWAIDFLSAALHGLLTNPASIWFGMSTGRSKLDQIDKIRIWIDEVTELMVEALNESNFQTEIHESYQDIVSFGTNLLKMEEDKEEIIVFESVPIYEGTISENHKGDVNSVGREFQFDALQIFEKFGELPEEIKRQIGDSTTKKFNIVHKVKPVKQAIFLKQMPDKKVVPKGMEYVSFYILKEAPYILEVSFFHEFCYAAARWTKNSGEKYGRSPLMKALPEVKTNNAMKKVTIQGAQLAIAPPVETPDNAFMRPLNLKPFGVNYKRASSKAETRTIFSGTRPDIGLDMIQDGKEDIKLHFFIDQLKLVISDRMTAAEVNIRRDQQLRSLGPTLGRLHRELLKPIINRLFGIMYRRGLFPDVPDELKAATKGNKFNMVIRYKSAIAKAQVTSEADNVLRAVDATGAVIEAQPETMDNIDGDELLLYNLNLFNAPAKTIRSKTKRDEIRKARAEAAKREQEAENRTEEADVINKIK